MRLFLIICEKLIYISIELKFRKPMAFKEATLKEAIGFARTGGDPNLVCNTIHAMGDVFLYDGDNAAALPWFLQENRIARERDDKLPLDDSLFHCSPSRSRSVSFHRPRQPAARSRTSTPPRMQPVRMYAPPGLAYL
jgi:hypothetical protein